MNSSAVKGFKRHVLITLIAVYFLIFVGSFVRVTGSGMGCPDWPKCFGSWIPPTSIKNLPATYKEDYIAVRQKKNEKFARFLAAIGMGETADQLRTDKTILDETEFNATKTWIEYVNRLVGVLVGLLIIVLVVKSFSISSELKKASWLSVSVLVIVLLQGWFGSIVVSTNLVTWTITVHMLMAFLLIGLLICLLHLNTEFAGTYGKTEKFLVVVCIVLLLSQVYFGTQVREWIDVLSYQLLPRDSWISKVGFDFVFHRSFSWAVLAVHVILFYRLMKTGVPKSLLLSLLLLILASVLTGIGMAYGSVPPWLQPPHLLIATVVFGLQMSLLVRMKMNPQ